MLMDKIVKDSGFLHSVFPLVFSFSETRITSILQSENGRNVWTLVHSVTISINVSEPFLCQFRIRDFTFEVIKVTFRGRATPVANRRLSHFGLRSYFVTDTLHLSPLRLKLRSR